MFEYFFIHMMGSQWSVIKCFIVQLPLGASTTRYGFNPAKLQPNISGRVLFNVDFLYLSPVLAAVKDLLLDVYEEVRIFVQVNKFRVKHI